MTGRGPELRASRGNDDAQTAHERRAQAWIGGRGGEGVALGVHRACERRIRRAHACGDRRTVAGRAAAALIRPRVAWRRQLRVGAVLADELAAAIGVVLVQEATDRNVDLIRVAEESFAIGGRELERLHVVVKERKRTRSE